MCLFLASHTTLSVTVLRTLLDKGVRVETALLPRGSRWRENIENAIPVYRPDSMDSVCETAGVALLEVDGVPSVDLLEENGAVIYREVEGYHARVVQHECDHLDGILYPQRMDDITQFGFEPELTERFSGASTETAEDNDNEEPPVIT